VLGIYEIIVNLRGKNDKNMLLKYKMSECPNISSVLSGKVYLVLGTECFPWL
jgi:hypothetical protein